MTATSDQLKVLLIEDDEDDHLLTSELLDEAYGSRVELTWLDSWRKGRDALTKNQYDVCLLDYLLGEHNGVQIVREAIRNGITTPIILLTGQGSRDIDLEAMRAGAADYLEKGKIDATKLERSIRYAIETSERSDSANEAIEVAAPRVLLVEDDEDDYLITKDLLCEIYGPQYEIDWVRNEEAALSIITKGEHDVYLVDNRLGKLSGVDLIRQVPEIWSIAPFILLTGQNSRDLDIEAMRAGASDYLVKGELTGPVLDRAIRYALERHRGGKELARLAQFDQLTGLANRSLFRDYLQRALARAERASRTVAVLFLDLDRFKIINDTFGHDTGDELLKEVAERLKHSVRASDMVARAGGDEFTIVVDSITNTDMIPYFGERVLQILKEPLRIGDHEHFTTASIGVAIYPDDADNLDDLIKSADAAMYKAKEEGGDNYQFFTVDLHIKASKRAALERDLREAIERRQFQAWYQPQIELKSGRISGFEALVRWLHPERGLIMPDSFIGPAEESGLINQVGELVLDEACKKLRELQDAGANDITMAVNFSARQFRDNNLVETVKRVIAENRVDAAKLEVEITENSILKDPETVKETLETLTAMGMRVALDDFGTGYSSLKHLRSFPANAIKVDRSFIQNVCESPDDASIVRAIVGMAHNLRLEVIAEGVETSEHLRFLRGLNCDSVQGYFFSKPLHPDDVIPYVLSHSQLVVEQEEHNDNELATAPEAERAYLETA